MRYLDNSATTQPCAAAVLAAHEMLTEGWLNPSAPYAGAVAVEKRVAASREAVARGLGVGAGEVFFTGSGTEADSLALLGSAERLHGPGRVLLFAGEHPAVLGAVDQLKAMGHQVRTVGATQDGLIDLPALSRMLHDGADLVSCMHVNNETGAVQPLAEVSGLIQKICPDALLHVDGVQGFLHVPLDLAATKVDLYAVSGHKVHGPKGVGALYVRSGVRLAPRVAGGGQEGGLRSGTENTAGIAAFAAAVSWAAAQEDAAARLRAMKLRLYERLQEGVRGLRVNGPAPDGSSAAPHILNVSFPGVKGEVMLHALEKEGVLVGTGAACSSKKRGMSAAFEAIAAPKWAADSAVRFSFGLMNSWEDADAAAEAALRCFARYRAFQRR
ncbi:MAG: aminotransferase class V-fold PLP-dependent enzyme [Firmicutes bacterium]|nr:aminotransferase class V-fold PLP-dependent enzyme [Bacillota bacterium]